MFDYLKLLFKIVFFWYIFFVIQKVIFLSYNYSIYKQFSLVDLLQVFTNGAMLDFSFVGYIMIFPSILIAIAGFVGFDIISRLLNIYHYIIISLLSLLFVIDLEILKWWGIRSDKTIFKFVFQVPGEVLATVSIVPVHWLVAVFLLLIGVFIYAYKTFVIGKTVTFQKQNRFLKFGIFILIGAIFVIPIRGGLQQIPINQSSAYFSNNNQLNLAAVNLPWNFAFSLVDRTGEIEIPYNYSSIPNNEAIIKHLYFPQSDSVANVLNTTNPNILLIIWESFTYKSILDSRDITPGFNKLKNEGVFFTNIYATGDRSDKGLTGILSGYPALPKFSIINEPAKASKIPSISKSLAEKGYSNSFYYGGEPEFANLKSYLLSSQFENIITKKDFPSEYHTTKWGVHDEYLFYRLQKDLPTLKEPFFTVAFTLSSHEPYDVPINQIKGSDNENRFCNSMYYADQELFKFIREAKKAAWWDNTLVIIIADHGHVLPGPNKWATKDISEFHIPMLWLGGAVKEPTLVNKLGSQTDLASTLLAQLDIDHSEYIFSKDLFVSKEFAYYTFNNGFGFLTPQEYLVYENVGDRILFQSNKLSDSTEIIGKALQEVSFRDYVDK